MERSRVKMPKLAAKGEIIDIKTLVDHVMESGQRTDERGNVIPRKIINKFTCEFEGSPVFACDFEPAIAINPYLHFTARMDKSGTFRFTWIDDDGTSITADETVAVI
jgi:sulfur-oxidizing protein SoxZ